MGATPSTRSPWPRKPTLLTMVALAVIVAVLLAGAVGLLRLRGGAAAGPSGASQTKPISFHGIQVLVPASWPLNDVRCSTPVHDTVMVGQSLFLTCDYTPKPLVSVVELKSLREAQGVGQAAVADQALRLAGHPGTQRPGPPARRPSPRGAGHPRP